MRATSIHRPMSDRIEIVEMAPRDGLQNEPRTVATADKIALVDQLSDCGFRRIEAASFVSPKWVPQMADGAEVMAGIDRRPGVAYTALTPNEKGYARARAAGADAVAVFGSASEGFSRANVNVSVDEALARFAPVLEQAAADGIPVRGYVSCVVVCPYDGAVAPAAVARVAERLADMGCAEISLGDTVGRGIPETVGPMLDAVLSVLPPERLAGHFHDTNGRACDNIEVALDRGITIFDACVGGIGGCPFAPGARGNVATEAVAALAGRLGLATGLDLQRLAAAATTAKGLTGQ